MKLRYIAIPALVVAALMTTSCIDDETNYGGNAIPTITVDVPATEDGELPEVNFNYGEEATIEPKISYDGSGELSYEWSVGTYDNGVKGPLEVVGTDRNFKYFFPIGGSYYAHLKITDGTVGYVQEYQVNINRSFEQGYLILSSDRDGNGNIVFIKDLTPEEKEDGKTNLITENCLERINPHFEKEPIVGAAIMRFSWPKDITRVLLTCESKAIYLDPNTFTAISTITYGSLISGFKADRLIPSAASTMVYDSAMKRYLTLRGEDMIAIESSAMVGHIYDVTYYGTYYAWGNQNFEVYYINRSPLEINASSGYFGWINDRNVVDDNGYQIFKDHELVNVFMGKTSQYYDESPYGSGYADYHPCDVISRNTVTGKYYSVRLRGFGSQDSEIVNMGRGEMAVTENTAIPTTEGPVAVAETYDRVYYHIGNRVYAMIYQNNTYVLPDKNQYCLSYPEDETVTYMTVNVNTDDLIVATVSKSTGRGNVYIYPVADVRSNNPDTAPVNEYKNCADRISYIVYKPRVANL